MKKLICAVILLAVSTAQATQALAFGLGLALATALHADSINFEDAYNDLGENGDPATYYLTSDGLTISGTYWGIKGGVANGNNGNWDLNGTNGPAFLGTNQGVNGSPTFSFDAVYSELSIDVGASHGSTIDFEATALLDGQQVAQQQFQIADDGNGTGTWQTVTFNTPLDEIIIQMTGSPNLGFAFGLDNLAFLNLACPWDCGGDNDGNTGITDFLLLLAQWGGPGTCDFDGGGVGINDFLALLANWGPCPQPTGACCFVASPCLIFSSADCTAVGGTYGGDGTACPTSNCCFVHGGGSCDDGSCSAFVVQLEPSCAVSWHVGCALLAQQFCGICGACSGP